MINNSSFRFFEAMAYVLCNIVSNRNDLVFVETIIVLQ